MKVIRSFVFNVLPRNGSNSFKAQVEAKDMAIAVQRMAATYAPLLYHFEFLDKWETLTESNGVPTLHPSVGLKKMAWKSFVPHGCPKCGAGLEVLSEISEEEDNEFEQYFKEDELVRCTICEFHSQIGLTDHCEAYVIIKPN